MQKDEFALLPGLTDKGCLGFAIQIKFRQIHGRYPESLDDIDPVAVQWVSEQVVVQCPNIGSRLGRGPKETRL